jgi:hypothetical protein
VRRLREVHSALRDAGPDTVKVAELAHRFGFVQFGRFAGTFGENAVHRFPNFSNFCIAELVAEAYADVVKICPR